MQVFACQINEKCVIETAFKENNMREKRTQTWAQRVVFEECL